MARMPSIANVFGMILVLGGSVPLAAQDGAPRALRSPVSMPPCYESGDVKPAMVQWPVPPADQPAAIGQPAQAQQKSNVPIPLPLGAGESSAPPRQAGDGTATDRNQRIGGLPSIVTLGGSLALVLGVFFLISWGVRRAAPAALLPLPGEVVEILGRAPLAGRQQMHLLRCGKKLLLVSVTPAGAETLTEITDPIEVDRLAGLCHQARSGSVSAAFRQVFQQLTQKDAPPARFGRVLENRNA
jgi:flagellar biogenesis protein FliO